MRNELELEGIIEDYLNGKLNEDEAKAFEQLRLNDPAVDHKVVAHKVFMESLNDYARVSDLKNTMNLIHEQMDVNALSRKLGPHPSFIVNLWRKNKAAIAVAASFILLTVVTIYSIQQTTQQTGSYEKLNKEVNNLRSSTNNLIRNVKSNAPAKPNVNPGKFGGTGFALSSNGYILTSHHVIEKSDSVYVQNYKGDSYKVKMVYSDPVNDIAILKITDKNFSHLSALPYSLKKSIAGMGEQVYTLGYPKDDVVFGKGYLSSKTGFNGDTLAYQVAITVNPGNSGGPLLDNNGNVIGIINAKESNTDGAAFAVKSKYIAEALNAIPQDSLVKRIVSGKTNQLQGLKLTKQIEKMQDFVFMIKVYN
ncbi:S1C family serine protease [Pedobacter heparinus]|uniref:Peptidase S1 and S6 chymotrypsin/Hap n=1 Tax=Pedobacter heparinus (strain ATCC 13125 / DSM 2366 / CIP 104194 / JCM 7457 / NBRC 12017 / NCIMB 9290 / NRRL B-14731 / HIM 762-3) TaxID=485917 RepID=C6Y1Y6_PEDHD|nr:serine protease [Pedobacter heparinus]ACU05128.1 peptidase S1 and S6 chymotrypsin/Hap [Pedobacter heparinus DSM 2366]